MTAAASEWLPVQVRDAREDDFSAIREIYSHHVLNGFGTFEEIPPDRDEILRRWREVTSRGLPYLAAEIEGQIQGYAYAATYRPRSAYRYTVEDSIYIAPGCARRGIGTALLSHLIETCGERGLRQMVAVIGDSGNLGSIRLHERLGFRRVGLLPAVGFKKNRWVDTVLMQRALIHRRARQDPS